MLLPNETIHVLVFGLGPTELIVILCILFLLFGANKIPQLARGLGKGITEFKKGLRDTGKDMDASGEIPEDTETDKDDKKDK